MYMQMDLFDFLERRTILFEQIFVKIEDPILPCTNCLCQYCVHNAEELYRTVKLEEAAEPPCFSCDECRVYTGDCMHREQAKEQCGIFTLSDYGAERNRKKIRIVRD